MKLLIACGGTGGHIYPALAVAEQFSAGEVSFVGSRDRLEKDLVTRAGFGFQSVSASRKNLLLVGLGVCESLILLLKNRPQVVFSTGGYVTAPVLMAAFVLKIPIVLQEQNLLPGKVNRFLGKMAHKICIAYKDSMKYFSKPQVCLLTGNPLRKSLFPVLKVPAAKPVILIMGGSLGARAIDEAVEPLKKDSRWEWIHLNSKHYVHDMRTVYAKASVAICRAGAMSLAELAAWGIPAILIPYPLAANDHQKLNAQFYVNAEAVVMLEQKDLSSEKLKQILEELLNSSERLQHMMKKMQGLDIGDSAKKIAGIIRNL
jgi:UDP-N-acetylglucosamine--N-acetylmuramyl-(pentapeptide) pyrophosphoryl-undecaprenol N-acetylglucosamine transferase